MINIFYEGGNVMFEFLRFLKRRAMLFKANKDISYKNISYVNWWCIDASSFWFSKLIENIDIGNVQIRFYSVFGPRKRVSEDFAGVKIFYSGENLEPFDVNKKSNPYFVHMSKERISKYGDYCTQNVDLSLGFSMREDENYIRLPLWIIDNFEPTDTLLDVQNTINKFEKGLVYTNRINGAVLMCSHDDGGTRKEIVDNLSEFMKVCLPGKFMHNTGDVWVKNKIEYLKKYKFNICSENVDADGYVSEKLLDSLKAGCIPIYVGSLGAAEVKIFNQNRIIYWNIEGDNTNNIKQIRNLLEDEKMYNEFVSQPLFCDGAAQYIFNLIGKTKKYIIEIVDEKKLVE